MYAEGASAADIGKVIGRTKDAVNCRNHRMGDVTGRKTVHRRAAVADDMQPPPEPFDTDEYDVGAIRSLGLAIIGRAMEDGIEICPGASSLREKARMRDEARAWFRDGGVDFLSICQLADMDPQLVQRKAAERFAEFDAKAESTAPGSSS
ncbi:MAG: hypothetical protein VW338_14550 [Rhodospirillaceae bacterium]